MALLDALARRLEGQSTHVTLHFPTKSCSWQKRPISDRGVVALPEMERGMESSRENTPFIN